MKQTNVKKANTLNLLHSTSQVSTAFRPSLSSSATALGIIRYNNSLLLCLSRSSFSKFSSRVFPRSKSYETIITKEFVHASLMCSLYVYIRLYSTKFQTDWLNCPSRKRFQTFPVERIENCYLIVNFSVAC